MKILICQINTTVGDFEGNYSKISKCLERDDFDLAVFPECVVCGYPQQDLLEYPDFVEQSEKFAERLVESHPSKSFLFGSVEKNRGTGRPSYNIAILASEGKVLFKYRKQLLPSYDVFDEDRFFEPGTEAGLFEFKGKKLGVSICEDIWTEADDIRSKSRYRSLPLEGLRSADLLVNLSASPFESSKVAAKREMFKGIGEKYEKPLVYVNAVGANDSIIFDGRSYFWGPDGVLLRSAEAYKEEEMLIDTESLEAPKEKIRIRDNEIEDLYDALVLGIQDYCKKQNFSEIILGMSGGIDSSLLACLAEDALGCKNVTAVMMPSRYTSKESNEDALAQASKTQYPLHIYVIEDMFGASLSTLRMAFEGTDVGLAEENLQSRLRGCILMAMSNKFGQLVLSTGNKSELAVGYCTLYGDMNGGLAPLSDVYKTQIYELAREANRRSQRIPERVFEKAPTAELREKQTDQDYLPEYKELDQILMAVIEGFKSKQSLIDEGFPQEQVEQVVRWVGQAEYKRYQMPLGLKVSSKAFGVGRRVPIVNRFFD